MTIVGTGTARVRVTCGEIIQGVLEGRPYQVPCPLRLSGRVRVTARPGSGVVHVPYGHSKTRAAANLALRRAGSPPVDLRVTLRTPVRRGAGMGSSTCDVVGTLTATSRALCGEIPPAETAKLAAEIEPTDGVMFDSLVAFDHVEGAVVEVLGEMPPMRLLVLDGGGAVETLDLHRTRSDQQTRSDPKESVHRDLLAQVRDGIRDGDPEAVGAAATRSARLRRLPDGGETFRIALDIAERFGGVGVVAAHSGTVAGALFRDDPARVSAACSRAVELPELVQVRSAVVEAGSGAPATTGSELDPAVGPG